MRRRRRVASRVRTAGAARRRVAGETRRARPVDRELREVLKAQLETGHELRKTKVPVTTEPAFGFKA